MSGRRLSVAGSLPALLALVLVGPGAQPAVPAQHMSPAQRLSPTGQLAPARTVAVTTEMAVEQVRYRNGKTDTRPPFKPLVAGESAFLRVRVVTDAARLPAGAARVRLELDSALAGATVRMAERDGVRRCVRIDRTVISCLVDRVLPGDEASMLVKVEIPAGVEETEAWSFAAVAPVGDLVVASATQPWVRLDLVGRGPWSGTWHWYATWSTGAWDGDGMQIYQPRDNGKRVVCATWPWSGGGAAWGTLNERRVWHGLWRDGFGEGSWELRLVGDNNFSGTQGVDVHNGADFTADITGRRTGQAVPVLDCDAIYDQVA